MSDKLRTYTVQYDMMLLLILLYSVDATQLKQLSGSFGTDVELRCVQIIQESQDNKLDCSNNTCSLTWTFENTTLTNITKYSFANHSTSGYCNLTEDSTDMYQKMNFTHRAKLYHVCEAHSLIIKDFDEDDLGEYGCNYTYNYKSGIVEEWFEEWLDMCGTRPIYNPSERYKYSSINVTGTNDYQSDAVLYANKTYQDKTKIYGGLLDHCVVSGGNVSWLARPCKENKCAGSEFTKLDTLLKLSDIWQCFTVYMRYSYPYPNITESMLAVKNICPSDNIQVVCSVDGKFYDEKSRELNIQIEGYYNGYHQRYGGYDSYLLAFLIVLDIFCILAMLCGLMFLFVILTIARAGQCCGS